MNSDLTRSLLDSAGEGLVALSEHGTIVEANESALRRLGRLRTHLLGKPFVSMVSLDDRRAFRQAVANVRANQKRAELTVRLTGQTETTFLELQLAPSRTVEPVLAVRMLSDAKEAGQPPPPPPPPTLRVQLDRIFRRFPHGVIGIWPDLRVAFTNQRARNMVGGEHVTIGARLALGEQSELGRLAERLVRLRVPMRPVRLAHDERTFRVTGVPGHDDEPAVLLIEDITREQQREKVTAEFLRNASHQLRTPLAAITAAIDVLQAGAKDDPEERDRFLEHIEQHVARMSRLTRGLLVLSRAQTGEQPLRLDLVQLRPLLARRADGLEPADGGTVELDCAADVAALGEPDLIEETIAALLDNAIAHTDRGTIRVAAATVDWQALIEVVDSGDGILPEHRGRVFEPFFQPWDDGRGFGLGLAIARRAVEAMDGTIEVAGGTDGGTRFLVRLPSARLVA
jgi:PAS domain S-box-containing protein